MEIKQILEERTRNDSSTVSPKNAYTAYAWKRKSKDVVDRKFSTLSNWKTTSLWKDCSTSLTRDKSPIHKIPLTRRFSSIEDDRKNALFLELNLSKDLKNKTSIKFPQSQRPNHFCKSTLETPSPATYHQKRFLDYPEEKALFANTAIFENPEKKDQQDWHSLNHAIKSCANYQSNGKTIPKSQNKFRVFEWHGRNMPYQPEITAYTPGVGKYYVDKNKKKTSIKFTMRKILTRFNESNNPTPGPGAYQSLRIVPSNTRRTIPLSHREDYFPKPNQNPAPNLYSIKRFLEEKVI